MKRIAWVVLGWLPLLTIAHAASFDCEKSNNQVEKLICTDDELSKLDEQMAGFYETALLDKNWAGTVRQTQKQWLTERNSCSDAACVKNAYVSRMRNIFPDNKARAVLPPRKYQARKLEASIPDDVLAELSHRSNFNKDELRELLKDCSNSQLAMNMCAFRSFVAADLIMSQVLTQKMKVLPLDCNSVLQSNQTKWAESRDQQCNKEADEEAGGGSMRPMLISDCMAQATEMRIERIKSMKSCDTLR
jgi:uncharacterized protein